MTDEWAQVYLGVGSSLDPEKNIRLALRGLDVSPGVEVKAISTFFLTPPLPAPGAPSPSVADDPYFLNGVLSIRTTLPPRDLTDLLADIENSTGRVRTEDPYAPRTLDLDILLYLIPTTGPTDKSTPLPVHNDVLTRAWVALPLFELSPELLLPPEGTPLAEVVSAFSGPGGVRDPLTDLLRQEFLQASDTLRGSPSIDPEGPPTRDTSG